MQGSQTISLKNPVSQQKNGIALVFSPYDGGVAKDYMWISHFVSKKIVSLKPNSGHNFICFAQGNGGQVAEKYLYISDKSIKGNDGNKNAPNNKWVLRYVLSA